MELSGRRLTERRIGYACVVAATALTVCPHTVAARSDHGGQVAHIAAVGGTVFGGSTAQGFPVVIETSKNGRKVTNAMLAIRLSCTSGARVTVPDGYRQLSVSKSRKFSASFGPTTNRNDDGTTTDFEGTISGTFNKSRTSVSGAWSFKGTDHDAAGAVTDTCDSGSVSWKAKQ